MSKWETVKLGDVCSLNMGQSPNSDTYNDKGIGMPFFQGNADFGAVNPNIKYWCSEPVKTANVNDILISVRAPIGALNIANFKCCIGRGLAAITVDNKIAERNFIWYMLKSKVDELQSKGTGSTFKAINKVTLYDVSFPLPPIDIQHQIAENLDKATHTIDLCNAILEKLDLLVKARFVEMFGDPFYTSKWQVKKLKEVSLSISDGSNIDKMYYQISGEVLFLRIQNVWFNEFRLDDSVYISQEVNNTYGDTSLLKGDLLITKIGRFYTKDSSLGRVAIYLGEDNKANYSNNIMRIRLKKDVNSEYVNALMNLDAYNHYIRKTSVGGTDKRALSKYLIGDFPIIIPPIELQNSFAAFVKQTDKSKSAVKQVLEKAETLKKALMQEYFG